MKKNNLPSVETNSEFTEDLKKRKKRGELVEATHAKVMLKISDRIRGGEETQ